MMELPLPRRTSAIVAASSSAGSNLPSACTPPSASRHLKRLSLSTSTSSLSSHISSDSPTLVRATIGSRACTSHSPHTPHRSTQHASGPTRSSLSSHPSESDEDLEENRDSTPLASASVSTSVSSPSESSSKPAWNFPSPIPASSTSAPSSAHAPRVATMAGSAAHHRAGSRSRRGSSISYSSSSSLVSLDPHLFNGTSLTQAASASNHNLGLGLGLGLDLGANGVAENDDGSDATSSASTSPQQSRRNSSLSTSVSFLSPTRSASGMTGSLRPTLTEQNADLLSFIAKKERKCLDLREELKRHEAELKSLKSKWESIVAKSLHSPTAPPSSVFPSRSPNVADPSMSRGPSHSLDIHLLASTFDPTGDEFASAPALSSVQSTMSVSSPHVGESVQAAKAWVGGVFGRVLSTVDETLMNVVGAHPPSSSSSSSISSLASTTSESGGLKALKEEDEDDSLASTIMSTSTKELVIEEIQRSSTTSTHVEQGDVPSSASNARPRTTLDVLSSGWDNMSKRLSTVNIGDTIRSSQTAASGLVDSFEHSIASALGPLDLPPARPSLSTPAEDEQNVAVVRGYRRPSKNAKNRPRALRDSSKANVVEPIGVVDEVEEEGVEGENEPREKWRG
ncbi:BQ2448_2642 [Microbotryum intermedium]|uniref:BQ2448_2642 protein n=1 Tax=Microbotryum intermedium TaxID=269621 RepID=A0A238F6Z0_9BASI|nr:BQ2448_2642 [Microbotryum intermedium]